MKTKLINSILFLLCLCLFACAGGGTTGTGTVRNIIFVGQLLDENGQALEGFTLTILETGESTVSTGSGAFRIDSNLNNNSINILVENDTFSRSLRVGDLPLEDSEVELNLEANIQVNSITLLEISITPITEPTPIPEDPDDGEGGDPKEDPIIPDPDDKEVLDSILIVKTINQFEQAVPGVTVRLIKLNQTKITNSSGKARFSIKTKKRTVNVRVALGGVTANFQVSLPNRPVTAEATVLIDIDPNSMPSSKSDDDVRSISLISVDKNPI